jgi:hypothetical protein
MSYIIRHPNGILENHMKCVCFWSGIFSTVFTNGPIVNYVLDVLNILDKHITYIMPQSDGDILIDNLKEYVDIHSTIVIGSVAQRFYSEEPKNLYYLLLPQDDGIFEHGLRYFIWPELLPKWEDRQTILFWRGSGSRRNGFLRRDVVSKLSDNPNADVKFIPHWIYKEDAIPETFIGENVNYLDFAKYKMVLIIDGNGISSAHSWCFGIGCVPFMITNNDFWFKPLLIPFGNYIPIKYDLSDLEEKIEWVLEHDLEAREIAERATTFAYHIFTPEFQQEYIRKKIEEINSNSSAVIL